MAPMEDDNSEVSVPTSAHALQVQKKQVKARQDAAILAVALVGVAIGATLLGLFIGVLQHNCKQRKEGKKKKPAVSTSDDDTTDDSMEEEALGEIVIGLGKRRGKRSISHKEVKKEEQEMDDFLFDHKFLEFMEEVFNDDYINL